MTPQLLAVIAIVLCAYGGLIWRDRFFRGVHGA